MKSKTFITMAMVGGGLVIIYLYLQKSGIWARWFPPANQFTDGQKLLAYCQAQNLAAGTTAIFVDPSGVAHTATCADWIHAQTTQTAGGSGGGQTAGLSAVRATDGTLLGKLRAAALQSPILGVDRANVDQWNLILRELDPAARLSDLAEAGIARGQNDMMNAEQFLALRHQAGLAAIAPADIAFENPLSWAVN